MNVTTIALGCFFIVAGLFFLYRSLSPEGAAGKLQAMQETWGTTRGVWLYRLSYVALPIVFGASAIHAGLNNRSLMAFLGN